MEHFLTVLLLTVATLIITTTGQHQYNTLSQEEKKYVDMAIIHANEEYKTRGEHMNYMSTQGKPVIKPHYTLFNMFLKSTTCTMANVASEHKHRPECSFKLGRPNINCVVCKTLASDAVFIDCIRNDAVSTVASKRNASCGKFLPGSSNVMARKLPESKEEKQLRNSLVEII
ncbi:uncharacterized protein ACWYII_009158 [Salvelinus alpinus]